MEVSSEKSQWVYLNGEFIKSDQAKVSVLDRGFLFGDGVYEVIPVYNRQPFRLSHHLQRLNASLEAVGQVNPFEFDEWQTLVEGLIERTEYVDQSIYLQLTRGVGSERNHAIPESYTPTVFMMSNALKVSEMETLALGASAITVIDSRWSNCHIKAITLLPNILLKHEATRQGCAEAILLRDGLATEGSSSNLFVVLDGVVITPPKSHFILAGITRDLVVELALEQGVSLLEKDISIADLQHAEEIWITSSTREILPITELDGIAVGNGSAGNVWRHVMTLFQDYKRRIRNGEVQ